jgi:hypothetical protein
MALAGRAPFFDWEEIRARYPRVMRALEDSAQRSESSSGFALTTGATEILLVPAIEITLAGRDLDLEAYDSAVAAIVREAAQQPHQDDIGTPRRSSRSILMAITSKWCQIPPICGRLERRVDEGG